MVFSLIFNIFNEFHLRGNMISETTITNLPSGKVRKHLTIF